jgi:hypothetical protein
MATEKLSNGVPVTVRFTENGFAELHLLSESEGMEHSEYIRHLVARDKELKRQKWAALNQVFASSTNVATNTANDDVGRSP